MLYETLLVTTEGPTATVTLNRPKVLNALNAQMLSELDAAFAALKSDASIHAILLTGSGSKAFAAGADINELAAADSTTGEQMSLRAQAIFRRIETLGKPVFACIEGFALGGGCELALACTLRLASETAKLGQPEIKLGILPGFGGSQRLPRLVGRSAALKMILTGAMISAEEALRIGLVDEVLPTDKLIPRATELAQTLASMPPLAIAASLEAIDRGLDLPLDQALTLEAKLFAALCSTKDKHEGTIAFLQKRSPNWTGR